MLLGSPSLCDLYVVCPLSAHVHDEQLTEKVIVVHMLLDLRVMCFLPMADMLKKKKIQDWITDHKGRGNN